MADFSAKAQMKKRNIDYILVFIYEVKNQFEIVLSKTRLEGTTTIPTTKRFKSGPDGFFDIFLRETGEIVARFSIKIQSAKGNISIII